jgi:hypothetical protein
MEQISKKTRSAFREHLVGWTSRTIGELFDGADVQRGAPRQQVSGQRRQLVEEYFAGLDWTRTPFESAFSASKAPSKPTRRKR